MNNIKQQEFRLPTADEMALFRRLMEAEFPGRAELEVLLDKIRVKTIDEFGSLSVKPDSSRQSAVLNSIPVEGFALDSDGTRIEVILHMRKGQMWELQIYRVDGESIRRMPPPSEFNITSNLRGA